ncbi:MAG TPA: translation initiation factor IF-2, partial [Bacillaceae bacterium]
MSKLRVYEYAKKQNVSSKEIINKLKGMNIEVSNHMSMIDGETTGKLDSLFKGSQAQQNDQRNNSGHQNRPKQHGGGGGNRQAGGNQEQQARSGGNRQAGGPQQQARAGGNRQAGGHQQQARTGGNRQAGGNQSQHQRKESVNRSRPQGGQPSGANKQSQGQRPRNADNRPAQSTPKQQGQGNKRNHEMGQNKTHMKNSTESHQNKNQQQRGNNNKGFNKNRRGNTNNKSKQRQKPAQHQPAPQRQKELPSKITFSGSLTVAELAKKLHREPSELIKKLFLLGVIATINQELDKDAIELICSDYGVEAEEEILVDTTDLEVYFTEDTEENLVERPSVVTIMGHVDHGKTTLLDSLRNTKVTAGEAGGITQHIGAYQIEANGKKITFLDTPGHAAFTTMRARGAKVTDITILVVAADDGVMPQTVEAINHAKAAEVPIIVAVNKIDKPTANPDRVMQELTEHGLVPEDWGGDTIFVPISALKGEGIDSLLEMVLLVSEVEEFKANPDRNAIGTVIEAQLDKGRGSVATLLVQNGTLKVGDPIVVGSTYGRVRAMVNDMGRRVKEAGPSTPVEITGLNDVPQAGDRFVVFDDEKTARQIGDVRAQHALQASRNESSRVSLDTLFEQMKQGEMKDLNIIIKADVQGS